VNDTRTTYTYDANGNKLTLLFELWQANAWVNISRGTYTYDANGNRLTFLHEEWQINAWVNDWRETYTYDANGNRLTDLREEWENNAWVNDWRRTYTYDANGNSNTGKYEKWQSGNWEPGNYFLNLYSEQQNIFYVNAYRYEASFVSFISGIESIHGDNSWLTVYPNPSKDIITIESDKNVHIEIINTQGQVIENVNNPNTKITVDVSKLSSGIYIIKAKTDKGIATKKFIKQ